MSATTHRLSGYSSTGVFVVRSGDRLIGPFDGRTPAQTHARQLHKAGFAAAVERLWSPAQALEAAQVRESTNTRSPAMISFTTSAFERSHGRKPRGRGYWLFQMSTRSTAFSDELVGEIMAPPGVEPLTLTEAKAEMRRLLSTTDGLPLTVAVLP